MKYRKRLKWKYRPSFSEMVSITFRKRMPQIVANILASNALMKRLQELR